MVSFFNDLFVKTKFQREGIQFPLKLVLEVVFNKTINI